MDKTIELNDVATYYKANKSGWQCTTAGHNYQIIGRMLKYYNGALGNYGSGSGLCGLTDLGLPLSNEKKILKDSDPDVYQVFERGVLVYSPSYPSSSIDNPPSAQNVFKAHLDTLRFNQLAVQWEAVAEAYQINANSLEASLNTLQAQYNDLLAKYETLVSLGVDALKLQDALILITGAKIAIDTFTTKYPIGQ